ncbi:glycosyltransferase family 61 protein [Pseudomonas laurentiana]|uniref:glycosyltransferase family 61 protein n=1 Tax=Pseudomonas laurentiana TaxID=2364649 RepID=UPI001679E92F|nr:glycosyltransferase family 61 protein [Pseudomonas laurentiana]
MESDVSDVNTTGADRKIWSLAAYRYLARKRLGRKPSENVKNLAVKSWDIAPSEITPAPPAFFLPGQLERVTGWEEARFFPYEHPRRTMEGLGSVEQRPTRGHLIKDVLLIDGALYKDDAIFWLSDRPNGLPRIVVDREIERGAAYCSPYGNRWFGTWLAEDCVTYPLACNEGVPVATAPSARFPLYPQAPDYEEWLGMQPLRLHSAFFRELVLFDDSSQNTNQYLRHRAMKEKILSRVSYQSHPGVFILRGNTGDLRLLRNELEIAEHLQKQRGFRILDPTKYDLPTIVATCAGARVVAGVEGSQLIHGVNILAPGASVLTLQPPNRFVCFYKFLTDRDQQHFGFVVGTPDGDGFRIDLNELERTLDLLPS